MVSDIGSTARRGARGLSPIRRFARSPARGAFAVLLLCAPGAARAQTQARDSLSYRVTLRPATGAADVEARWYVGVPGAVALVAPADQGVSLTDFSASDAAGRPVAARRTPTGFALAPPAGTLHLRYRVGFLRRAPEGSTSSGMDAHRLYAVTRHLFVAPDPTALRKTARPYPVLRVRVDGPPGWRVVGGWRRDGDAFRPADGDALLGATIAAAEDYRLYEGTAGGAMWRLGVRGHRYFADSALVAAVAASLARGAAVLGPVPETLVTYTADVGPKGRMSGSLQGTASIGLVWEPSEILALGRTHDLFHETLHLWFGGALETERWWVEGVTDYLAARLAADWRGTPEDLASLCFQSLRHYREIGHATRYTMAEENRRRIGGDNTDLLVYRKGMLAGLLLDAAYRRDSEGRRTLDDLARGLLAAAGQRRSRFVPESEARAMATRLGGPEVAAVWERVVAGTDLLTEEDVRVALRVVTGRTFEVPPPLSKERKELRRESP